MKIKSEKRFKLSNLENDYPPYTFMDGKLLMEVNSLTKFIFSSQRESHFSR